MCGEGVERGEEGGGRGRGKREGGERKRGCSLCSGLAVQANLLQNKLIAGFCAFVQNSHMHGNKMCMNLASYQDHVGGLGTRLA